MTFISRFGVPGFAVPVIGDFVTPDEVRLIEVVPSDSFTSVEARFALEESTGEPWPDARVASLLNGAYERGVLQLQDESLTNFSIGSFYVRAEVFALSDPAAYLALPRDLREAIDDWCFATYLEGLSEETRPTSDRVSSLEETLAFIDSNDNPVWLNRCDCRTLSGRCDLPTDVCVSFRNGINTLGHRGVSKPISREEAKSVVLRADADGLMHTVNEQGICNCCSDCCYLFRAQAARGGDPAVWPLSESVVALDTDLCIGCEVCVARCPFGAIVLEGDGIEQRAELCRGCGLCVETCPTGALAMVARAAAERSTR